MAKPTKIDDNILTKIEKYIDQLNREIGLKFSTMVDITHAIANVRSQTTPSDFDVLKRIGYDNDYVTSTERWIATESYKIGLADAESRYINAHKYDHNKYNIPYLLNDDDLPNNSGDAHFPRVEVMQEDYGDHNGYTSNIRMADAKLIVAAPNMKDAIKDALEFMDMGEDEFINISWIRSRLQSAIKDLQ